MISSIPPGLLLIFLTLLLPMIRGKARRYAMLAIPIISFLHLVFQASYSIEINATTLNWFGYELSPIRIDRLSMVWGVIFHIAALLCVIYSFEDDDLIQQVPGLIYAGSAIGAVFAGDFLTLFLHWELTAISSVFLIWAARNEQAVKAGVRYLIVQVASGVLLLSGTLLIARDQGTIEFGTMDLGTLPGKLIFIAFGIKAAFPLLHAWVQDAYPKATISGTVFLSAFTTKMAIYALARGFAGTEILIGIGAVMIIFPMIFAVIENDLRKMLAYSLNDQLGYMVVGIGIGTPLAINGAAAHAFVHILYKGLLFMSVGAVMTRTGTAKAHELGGLYRSMPWTAWCCMIGSASICAVPLFSGFVTKSLIISAAAEEHLTTIWLILLIASSAVVMYSGIRVPHAMFFGKESDRKVREAPSCMLVAMSIAAALCIVVGVAGFWPAQLFSLLPYEVDYHVYDVPHVVTKLQLLSFAALGYFTLTRTGLFPAFKPGVNVDFDWTYRVALPMICRGVKIVGQYYWLEFLALGRTAVNVVASVVYEVCGPRGIFARTWSTGGMVLWAAVLLCGYLVLYYT